jgi:protein-S-isoprenylcysteine O-methyltransferase Ste14
MIIKAVFSAVILPVAIFGVAGRLNYWQGWVFGILNIVIVVFALFVFSKNKDLLKERIKPGPGIKWWDRIFTLLYIPSSVAVIVVSVLDAGKLNIERKLPFLIYVAAYAIFIFSVFLLFWAVRVNNFFSSVVRIQKDRNQTVVQNGPYRFIRHPGYSAIILIFISMPVTLGSVWGFIPSGLTLLLLIIRTYLEDSTLKKELAGYDDYVKKVKWRLVPYLW